MQTINIHDAKTNFSKLVDQAAAGEEIIIAKAGTPMARLVPLRKEKRKIHFGVVKGEIKIGQGFYDPMTEEDIALFEGSADAPATRFPHLSMGIARRPQAHATHAQTND